MSFVAEFDNTEIKKFVDNIKDNLKKVKDGEKKYLGLISVVVFRDVMDHFRKEQGVDGKWKEWSPIYKEHMDEIGKGGNKILQDSGNLRQNFLPSNYKSSYKGRYWFNNAKTRGGFSYAFAHNEGGKKLPKRDFMWLSNKALEDIVNNTLGFMMEHGIK